MLIFLKLLLLMMMHSTVSNNKIILPISADPITIIEVNIVVINDEVEVCG